MHIPLKHNIKKFSFNSTVYYIFTHRESCHFLKVTLLNFVDRYFSIESHENLFKYQTKVRNQHSVSLLETSLQFLLRQCVISTTKVLSLLNLEAVAFQLLNFAYYHQLCQSKAVTVRCKQRAKNIHRGKVRNIKAGKC